MEGGRWRDVGEGELTQAELVGLLASVGRRDETAFAQLYEATCARLFGMVLRIVRHQDVAEEVVQEAYVRIWHSAGQFNPDLAAPIAWMASIARKRAIDVVRKRGEPLNGEAAVASDTPEPIARQEMSEDLSSLLACVGRLDPEAQKLVLLAYYNGWSRAQLAEKFALPPDAVRASLRQSMMDLRPCLGLA
jgi:RNA polymerase sigma-70 factor (ECF subfamily)